MNSTLIKKGHYTNPITPLKIAIRTADAYQNTASAISATFPVKQHYRAVTLFKTSLSKSSIPR
jgi:RNA binding exosome subunit